MIPRDKNPEYLNSFLDYSITILNKIPFCDFTRYPTEIIISRL